MQSKAIALGAIGFLALGVAVEPTWDLVRAPGTGCWPPQCGPDQLPLATPVIPHANGLVMLGDGAASNLGYESRDGRAWRAFTHDASWGKRYKAADASFAGALWRVGGWIEENGQQTAMNDVWRSADGRHWQRVLARAPWSARSEAHLVVFRDTLWLLGGEPIDPRIWLTTDGRHWIPRPTASLPRENPQGVLVHRGALWILGHGRWETARNDVWTSRDGSDWTRVTANARWAARTDPGFAVLDDRLWVVAGCGFRDTWSSADGLTWRQSDAEVPGPPRCADFSAMFQNAYWVFGGKTGGAGGTGYWDGVVVLK